VACIRLLDGYPRVRWAAAYQRAVAQVDSAPRSWSPPRVVIRPARRFPSSPCFAKNSLSRMGSWSPARAELRARARRLARIFFAECNEVRAYGAKHRHLAEIEQELEFAAAGRW